MCVFQLMHVCAGMCRHVRIPECLLQVCACILCVCYLRWAPGLQTGPLLGSWVTECTGRAQPSMPAEEDTGPWRGSGSCSHICSELRIHGAGRHPRQEAWTALLPSPAQGLGPDPDAPEIGFLRTCSGFWPLASKLRASGSQ